MRYYTTWIETSDQESTATSAVGSSAGTSIPGSSYGGSSTAEESDPFAIDLNELNSATTSGHSFPNIQFTRSGTPDSDEAESSDESVPDPQLIHGFATRVSPRAVTPVPTVSRTLYIQMVRRSCHL